jgi:deoxyribodipyrimidine photolyase
MPYVPRQATIEKCAFCNADFEKKHASRKYCSNVCNVQASYARTGYREQGRATRAELEAALAKMVALVDGLSTLAPAAKAASPVEKTVDKVAVRAELKEKMRQAGIALAQLDFTGAAKAEAQTKKPAAKAAVKQAPKTAKTATKPAAPAAKAAATKPVKKITKPAPPKKATNKPKKAKSTTPTAKEEEIYQSNVREFGAPTADSLRRIDANQRKKAVS